VQVDIEALADIAYFGQLVKGAAAGGAEGGAGVERYEALGDVGFHSFLESLTA